MRLSHLLLVVAFVAVALPAPAPAARTAPACPAGQTSHRGKCVPACATEGAFRDPDACECPAGYGKILTGDGGGQCSRLRCPTNAELPAGKDCDCPPNYEKQKTGKGKVRCEARQAQAR